MTGVVVVGVMRVSRDWSGSDIDFLHDTVSSVV
jgi:hypothetical protein